MPNLPPWSKCGDHTGFRPCTNDFYCQPWDRSYYQCIQRPRCYVETNIDYYGNDIKRASGIGPSECCEECGKTPGCDSYTYINDDPTGTQCYLKSSNAGRSTKIGAVSGYPLLRALDCLLKRDLDHFFSALDHRLGALYYCFRSFHRLAKWPLNSFWKGLECPSLGQISVQIFRSGQEGRRTNGTTAFTERNMSQRPSIQSLYCRFATYKRRLSAGSGGICQAALVSESPKTDSCSAVFTLLSIDGFTSKAPLSEVSKKPEDSSLRRQGQWQQPRPHHTERQCTDQQFVCERIQERADDRLLMERPRDEAVQPVGHACHRQHFSNTRVVASAARTRWTAPCSWLDAARALGSAFCQSLRDGREALRPTTARKTRDSR
ncbi:PAN/Apple domain [Phytophthora cactorum]|nr:PAN/Apple domain [Phytophthora cactorum]